MSTNPPMSSSSHETDSTSLKSSPSKREKVRKFIRRMSSIGHRRRDSELSLDGAVAGDVQTRPTIAHSQSEPLIDLTAEPEPIPVKVARRDSIISSGSSAGSALKHAPLVITNDDASSFHSSAASSSSDAHSVTSSRRQSEDQKPAEPQHVEPEQPAEKNADESASADPAPAVFIDTNIPQEEKTAEPAILSAISEAPSEAIRAETAEVTTQAEEDDCVIVDNPFSDDHQVSETVGSQSPDLGPTASDDAVEPMELDHPASASPIATVGESPERVVEVTSQEGASATSTAVSPVDNTPYVVVHPATPVAKAAPAAPSSPSPSSSEPSREVTLYSRLHSGIISLLRKVVPGKQTVARWRAPICYTLMCLCYTLTWYLRRPVPEVPVNRFMMY